MGHSKGLSVRRLTEFADGGILPADTRGPQDTKNRIFQSACEALELTRFRYLEELLVQIVQSYSFLSSCPLLFERTFKVYLVDIRGKLRLSKVQEN